jgi:hypothetical protein
MRKLILTILFILSIVELKAQGFEFSVQANTGLSYYVGQGTLHSTFLNVSSVSDHSGYPNGDGNIASPIWGTDLQFQYTFKSNFVLGVQTGYEQISYKVDINGVYDGAANETQATGYTNQHNGYININPYLGYRLKLDKVRLDVLPGFDIALGTNSYTTVNVKASDGTFYNKPSYDGAPATEIRARLGLAAYYQKFGITASYSHGTKDYNSGLASDSVLPTLYTELFRVGLSYRIR